MAKRLKGQPNATEMTFASDAKEWINGIIQELQIPFGKVRVEQKTPDGTKRTDIQIPASRSSEKAVCVIEFKQVYIDVFSIEHINQAYGYATRLQCPYFCVCNGKVLVWFDTQIAMNSGMDISRAFINQFDLSKIKSFDDVSTANELKIKEGLREFLKQLHLKHNNKVAVPLKGLNEFLIVRLHRDIEELFGYYLNLVHSVSDSKKFIVQLQNWFDSQGWSFTFSDQDYEVVARQASYLLVNKILVYTALRQRWNLDPLEIPDSLKNGGVLMDILSGYFNRVLQVDYNTIFTTDSLNIGFPDEEDAVSIVRNLVKDLNTYDLANIGYDVIGYIFERLIPQDERHKLGQYFTRAEVVDFILAFCSKNPKDKIFDPAVGAGTFLVRSYQYKKVSSWNVEHDEIIPLLWGCDIVQFPAHLTAINIAVRGLHSTKNFPRILNKDFFRLTPDNLAFRLPITDGDVEGNLFDIVQKHVEEKPTEFDVIIGNPPYTRQEYLGDMIRSEDYKKELQEFALYSPDGSKIANLSKRAGLYAYFFIHAYKFLKEGGRLGFITANPWLNAAYGSGLQEFLLKHFKIVAIIESDIDRWFPGVAVDNCIVILEKCSTFKSEAERDNNLIKFVRLIKPLVPIFAPPTTDDEQTHRERFDSLRKFVNFIENTREYYDGDDLKIYPKRQGDLLEEGVEPEKEMYSGTRWGRFINASPIFYKLTNSLREKFAPMSELSEISYGLKTGANEFFYLTEDEIKHWDIEKTFWGVESKQGFVPNYVLKSPTESESIFVEAKNLKQRALLFNQRLVKLNGTKAYSYIRLGEKRAFNERATCRSRDTDISSTMENDSQFFGWYDLGKPQRCHIFWPELSSSSRKRRVFFSEIPIIANSKLYNVIPVDVNLSMALLAVVNSTVVDFLVEFSSQSYGGFRAPSNLSIGEARKLLVPDIRQLKPWQIEKLTLAIKSYGTKKLGSIRTEYGMEEDFIDLSTIDPDLRIIDKIVMEDLLGLSEEEQFSLYSAVVSLSEGRLDKAQSGEIKDRGVIRGGIDESAFVETVLSNCINDIGKVKDLYNGLLRNRAKVPLAVLPPDHKKVRGRPIIEHLLWGYQLKFGGDKSPFQEFSGEQRVTAEYCRAWALLRTERVDMPTNIENLSNEVDELVEAIEDLIEVVDSYTSRIVDFKQRKQLESVLWNEIRPSLVILE